MNPKGPSSLDVVFFWRVSFQSGMPDDGILMANRPRVISAVAPAGAMRMMAKVFLFG